MTVLAWSFVLKLLGRSTFNHTAGMTKPLNLGRRGDRIRT